jgi:asparagine synthase (glutamine-hydrolysing)
MCGILLAVERHGPVDRARFKRALDCIRHRGPDGEGIAHIDVADGRGGTISVALGHRRLSILDLSERASQPFRRDAAALTYNGEIYNFRALRGELDAAHFTTDGDTEVLFEIMRTRGLSGLADALGMWAFCHLDEATGQIIAARDRLGKKPLFYFASDTTICFASEIAAIMTYLRAKPRMARATIDTYLAYGWTLPGAGEVTPIEDIRQVTPGGHVTVDLASWRIETGSYIPQSTWAPVDQPPHGDLAEMVRSAVLDRLVSDRQVGLLLSGGIDSSLILSVLCAAGLQDQIHCFIGEAGKSEDAEYAARVTSALGVTAEVIPLDYTCGSIDRFLSVCKHQEKPFPLIGNVLGLPELYERIAARDVPVVLDGTGADEIFGGYWERYYRFALVAAWDVGDTAWIDQMLSANNDLTRIAEIGRTTMAALRSGTWPPPSTTGAAPTGEISPLLAAFCQPEVARAAPADRLARKRLTLAEALHFDTTANLLPEWLWQNDRNAMRSGVENRSPFLDTRLTAHLGSGYSAKFVGPWNKYELRQLFDRFRPAPTQWRREKQGFRWVFARFLRQNRAAVLELIAASSLVRSRVHFPALLNAIAADEELLFSDLTQRCLVLAGVEAATGMAAR